MTTLSVVITLSIIITLSVVSLVVTNKDIANLQCYVLPLWFSGIPKIVLQKFPSWR